MARRLPLRARLALLTAVAVAVAVAASALSCWFITRAQLRNTLDQSLVTTFAPIRQEGGVIDAGAVCGAGARAPDFQRSLVTYQIVASDGTSCHTPGAAAIPVSSADKDVANGNPDDSTFHDATASDGTHVRVYTRNIAQGVAVSIARPLTEIDHTLDKLTLLLVIVTGIGVVGAASAGLLIARAALRPVDELTDVVEHIARTEDLDATIEVSGKDEIARLGESFNAMTSSLKASRERQQQLIADAGHELRTPLTSLRTNTDLLLRSEELERPLPAEDKKRLLRNVRAQLRELSGLVGDLLELARPDRARGAPQPGVGAFHTAIEHAVERARLRAQDAVIEVDVKPWYVRGETADLERAVVNLLDNAIKFGPPGGTIEVRLKDGELTVRDHGQGISPDDAPHVFERFWRSDAARSLPGSGLGLAIVARTVQAGGGTVALLRAEGGGTLARLRLPGTAKPPQAEAPPKVT